MKQIFLIIGLLLIALSVSAQDPSIDRGSGVMYFSGVPGYEPDTTVQSEIAYNLLSRELWVFNRDSVKWKKNSAYSQSYADPSGDPTPGPFLHVNRADGGIFQWTGAAWEEFTPGTSAVADGVTILGDGTGGDPFTVDTTLIATIQGVADSGYVVGPASATDNAIARYDATTGKLIQNSAITIGDAGAMTLNGGNIILNGEYLSGDGGDEGIYVDANGYVYVGDGTETPISFLHLASNTSDNEAGAFIMQRANDSSTRYPILLYKRSRGSLSSPTALTSGNIIGAIALDGHIGSGFEGLRRVMQVDATENWGVSNGGFGWGFYIRNNGSVGAPSEVMRLEHNGNVGIQETDPAHELDVTGDISATGSLISDGGDVQLNSVGDVFVKTNAGTPESAVTGDPGALVLDVSNGAAYVKETGISSTGWGQLATIQGVADSGYVVGPASATDNAIARYDATTGKLIQNSAITIGDAGAMTLNGGNILLNGEWLSGDGGDEGVFVASDGRVGVGNSAPVSALDINSTGVTTAGPAGIDITNMITSTVSSSGIQGVMFRNNSTSSTAEVRFITIANNIGEYMAFTTPSTTNSGTFFGDTKGGGNFIFSSGRPLYLGTIQTDDILFGTNNSTIHMIIDHSSSNVGIGDETPSTKLDVNGDITAQGGTINLNSALDVFVQTNAGTPEAAVTADPGSLILDTSNGATYVKETGTSSTGWAQLLTDNLSSASAPVLFAEHSVTGTGTLTSVIEIQKTTTATMVNGFGPGLYFAIRDVDAVDNAVGAIGVVRAGADNSGEMRFYTSNAGVSTLGQTIEADQDILFDEYTTNAKNGVGTMNAYVTMDANGQLYRMENSRAAMRVSGGSTSFVSATPERVDGDTPGTTTDLGSTSDWTVSGSGMSYTGTVTRDFKILCELDGTTDSVSELDFYIAEEGTVISGTIMETTIGNANDNHSVSLLWIVSAATNDTYEVYVDGDANENYTNNNLVCTIEPWDN